MVNDLVNPEHFENAAKPIFVIEFGIRSCPLNPEQLKKAEWSILMTVSGMIKSPENPEQFANDE